MQKGPSYDDMKKFMMGQHDINKRQARLKEMNRGMVSTVVQDKDLKDAFESLDKSEEGKVEESKNAFSLTEHQARYCYGMSKMTLVKENLEGYRELLEPEFIEMLGRLASEQYKDDQYDDLSYYRKLELTLTTALAHINEKMQPVIVEEEESRSFDD